MFAIRRRGLAVLCALGTLGVTAQAADARTAPAGAPLDWEPCESAPGWECATATVPKDYERPGRGSFTLAVTRLPATDQANKIGSLFISYGGPGGTAVDVTQAIGADLFAAFTDRFDLVAFDPRGTGQTSEAWDCEADQERLGVYSQPFFEPGDDLGAYLARIDAYWARCQALNPPDVLPYTSTANYARDMNRLRRSVGDAQLTYFGFSYGTFIGATYAALFPHRMRALVLDGAVDPDAYINRPMAWLNAQTAAFEKAFGRLMMSCAARPAFCTFGGADPWLAFDKLVERADLAPIPAGGSDPRPSTATTFSPPRSGRCTRSPPGPIWRSRSTPPPPGTAPAYGSSPTAFWPPGRRHLSALHDRYSGSAQQRYPRNLRAYLEAGELSWASYDHAWWNAGYVELYWRAIPARVRDAHYGPWQVPGTASTPLVVAPGTTRPRRTARQNRGAADGQCAPADHERRRATAYFNGSECIDAAINAYVSSSAPARGHAVQQEVPFPLPAQEPTAAMAEGTQRIYAGRLAAPLKVVR